MTDLTYLRALTDQFTEEDGRRPRLLLAALSYAADERALRLYAAAMADAGFDIDICPLKQSPLDTARIAAENDVHAIGLCGLMMDEASILSDILSELKRIDRGDIPCFIRIPASFDWDTQATLARFASEDDDYHREAQLIITRLMELY